MKKLGMLALFMYGAAPLLGCMPAAGGESEQNPTTMILMYVGVMVVFFVAMYFIAIRPQRKQQKEQQQLLASMQVGDTVLTSSGFYGVVIDITDDTVIVEFGSNKNCRIPMQKSAVVQLEHPEGAAPQPQVEKKEDKTEEKSEEKPTRKLFGRK